MKSYFLQQSIGVVSPQTGNFLHEQTRILLPTRNRAPPVNQHSRASLTLKHLPLHADDFKTTDGLIKLTKDDED